MNNYIFIIWNKALFCERRILDDLRDSFVIEKYFYVEWNKDVFIENSKALYGHKSTDAQEKVKYTGKGKFLIILIRDDFPVFKEIETPDGKEHVNTRILEKKKLYRKWTGDNYRVHASTNKKETNHDLTILFGNDYSTFLGNINDKETIKKETIFFNQFRNTDELKKLIESLDENFFYLVGDNKINLFVQYKTDIKNILNPDGSIDNRLYVKRIGEKDYFIKIYGEKDGDIPDGFIKVINNDLLEHFVDIQDEYDEFLNNRSAISANVSNFFEKYGFEKEFKEKEVDYKPIRKNFERRLKDRIKYLLAVIRNR